MPKVKFTAANVRYVPVSVHLPSIRYQEMPHVPNFGDGFYSPDLANQQPRLMAADWARPLISVNA